ncbi:MAG TPA: M24 family metallopeptidase [Anaerolineales bacterium]|jgi:Xaa-Pro aminopeptidase|nr:M24 family metallopeptidase [Anaerolineales bacterium]
MKSDLPALMKTRNLDALLIFGDALHNPPMVYFTGVHHVTEALLVIKRGEEPLLFSHNMERDEAAATGFATRSVTDYRFRDILKESNDDFALASARMLQRMLTDAGVTKGRAAVYGKRDAGQAFGLLGTITELLPELEIVGEIHDSVLTEARATKDAAEVERIRAVQKQTTEIVGQVADFLSRQRANDGVLVDKDGKPITVAKVKSKINLWIAERGLDNPEGTIFAPGAEGGVPHSMGSPDAVLRVGEPIVFDIFPKEAGGGYWSDFTRTWCLGYATDAAQALYDDVRFVYDTLISEIHADERCAVFQARTCELFKQRGHPTVNEDPTTNVGYVHSLAHGLGLDVHESPGFYGDPKTAKDFLRRGHVITVEPGLYYPERGMGMRIEDAVHIGPEGKPEILATYPLDLVIPLKS